MPFDTYIDSRGMKVMAPQQQRAGLSSSTSSVSGGGGSSATLKNLPPAEDSAITMEPETQGDGHGSNVAGSASASAEARLQPGIPATAIVKNPTASRYRVHVFWDLDNKRHEHVHPEDLAENVKDAAAEFGTVQSIMAYGNPKTFQWVPRVEQERRRAQKEMERQEAAAMLQKPKKRGKVDKPYQCEFCGRHCATMVELKKHFKQLHERQRKKEMSHPSSRKKALRKTKRSERYHEAKMGLFNPRSGVNLGKWLKRSGCEVVPVGRESQAADTALQRDVGQLLRRIASEPLETRAATQHVLMLCSDDRDFCGIMEKGRALGLVTVAVCEDTEDYPSADVTVDWDAVQGASAWDPMLEANFGESSELYPGEEMDPGQRLMLEHPDLFY